MTCVDGQTKLKSNALLHTSTTPSDFPTGPSHLTSVYTSPAPPAPPASGQIISVASFYTCHLRLKAF